MRTEHAPAESGPFSAPSGSSLHREPRMSPRADLALRVLVTVLAAAVLPLIAPPANLHFLHWFAYVPMLWVLRASTPRANRWLGFLYGFVGVGLIFHWLVDTIVIFSNLPLPVAYAILALFAAAFGLPYVLLWGLVHPLRERLGNAWVLAIPAVQVLIEFLSAYIFLFPYSHGVSQYRVAPTWQLASITGVWGISFLIFFVNCVLGEAVYRRRERRGLPVGWMGAAAATLALVVGYGAWRHARVEAVLAEAPVLQVAQLQLADTMNDRRAQSPSDTFEAWLELTRRFRPGEVDLVVWPEGASPFSLQRPQNQRVFASEARRGGFDMIVGSGARERVPDPERPQGRFRSFNSVFMVSRDGTVGERYDKMVPLPFGEYMPLVDVLPFLAAIEGVGDFAAGTHPTVLQGTEGLRFASPICYEAILAYTCRLFERPDVLVNVTNDAWFGDTAAPHQHAMLAAVRTVEMGVPMIRSAYSGVSMIIEPHGRITYETAPFVEVARPVEVRLATFPTFYARFGDWFVWLCAVGLGGGLLVAPWLRRDPEADA